MSKKISNNICNNDSKPAGLSGSTLKIIAMISMLIDHCSFVFLGPVVRKLGIGPATFSNCISSGNKYAISYIVGRIIGRVAFVLFCFLLVQGFFYTRSRAKYLYRLILFSLISEIPFDLAFWNSILEYKHQNVFFTLTIGLMAMIAMELANKSIDKYLLNKSAYIYSSSFELFVDVLIVTVFAVLADLLRTDYGAVGVVAILSMYYMCSLNRNKKIYEIVATFVGAIACLASSLLEISAIAAVPLVAFYNGKRGVRLKYIFYLFYPMHLMILYIIKLLIA